MGDLQALTVWTLPRIEVEKGCDDYLEKVEPLGESGTFSAYNTRCRDLDGSTFEKIQSYRSLLFSAVISPIIGQNGKKDEILQLVLPKLIASVNTIDDLLQDDDEEAADVLEKLLVIIKAVAYFSSRTHGHLGSSKIDMIGFIDAGNRGLALHASVKQSEFYGALFQEAVGSLNACELIMPKVQAASNAFYKIEKTLAGPRASSP